MSVAAILQAALVEIDALNRASELKVEWRHAIAAGDHAMATWIEREILVWLRVAGITFELKPATCPVMAANKVRRLREAAKFPRWDRCL